MTASIKSHLADVWPVKDARKQHTPRQQPDSVNNSRGKIDVVGPLVVTKLTKSDYALINCTRILFTANLSM